MRDVLSARAEEECPGDPAAQSSLLQDEEGRRELFLGAYERESLHYFPPLLLSLTLILTLVHLSLPCRQKNNFARSSQPLSERLKLLSSRRLHPRLRLERTFRFSRERDRIRLFRWILRRLRLRGLGLV